LIKLNQILDCVAENFELDIQKILGPSQKREICEARFFFCLISRNLTARTLESIGNHINRDHCTVLHGIRKANDLIDIYPEMKSLYNKIINEISVE